MQPMVMFAQKPKPARESSSWRTCGRMLAVSWYDNKPVYFFSTVRKPLHAPDTQQANKEVKRRSKQGVVQVPCPTTSACVDLTGQTRTTGITVLVGIASIGHHD